MLGNIGTVELLIIMLVILLVFGSKRIPEVARGLGQGIREFKAAASEISKELRIEEHRTVQRRPAPAAHPDAAHAAASEVAPPATAPSAPMDAGRTVE